MTAQALEAYERCSEKDLAARVAAREPGAVRLLIQRNNQRLFRVAWSILRNRAEAEDAVQEAYVRAFAAMTTFRGLSSLSTWLTRIVINEALARKRASQRRTRAFDANSVLVLDEYREKLMGTSERRPSPEIELMRKQLTKLLEDAISRLPDAFRTVFVLREVEGLSVEETSEALQLRAETVRTRLGRAHRRLRAALDPEFKAALSDAFLFAGADCEAMTERVMRRLLSRSEEGMH